MTEVRSTQTSYVGSGGGDDYENSTGLLSAAKMLWSTVVKEAGKSAVGLLNTNTEAVKYMGETVDSLNGMIRLIIQNEKKICGEKFDMLRAVSNSVTGGVLNVMKSSRTIGDEGAKALSGILQKVTDLGVTTVQTGGNAAGASLGIGNQALKTTTKLVGVPITWAKAQTGKALSSIGIVNNNKVDESAEEEQVPLPQPPQRTGTRKVTSKKSTK